MKTLDSHINKDAYEVLLFSSPGNIPMSFASHQWFMINKKGEFSRWELLFRKLPYQNRWGHIYKDFFPPFKGIEIFRFSKKYLWNAKYLGKVEGELALRMMDFIENSKDTYPHRDSYSLLTHNSNTYIKWVLKEFPEADIKLPWNAFG